VNNRVDKKAMPEIARNIAEPLAKVDKITMYGDGNSSKLVKDIVGTLTQVTDGLKESTGVDLQSVLSGFLGMKVANDVQRAKDAEGIKSAEIAENTEDTGNMEG